MSYELDALEELRLTEATTNPTLSAAHASKAAAYATLALNETINNLVALIINEGEKKENQLVEFIISPGPETEPSPSPSRSSVIRYEAG